MSTTTTTDPTAVLRVWEAELARLGDPGDVPQTYNAQAAYERQRSWLDGHIRIVRASLATLAEVEPQIRALAEWRTQLEGFRAALVAELFALPSPVRTPQERGRLANLTRSIQTVDRGTLPLEDSGWALETLALGQLMRDAGFVEAPPTEGRSIGTLPWAGGLAEIDKRLADLAHRRDDAASRLDSAIRDRP